MTGVNKLSENDLEQVSGGTVETFTGNPHGTNVHVYAGADKKSRVLFNLNNGQKLFKTGTCVIIDGKTWYEVQVPWHSETGWVESSLIYDRIS